MSEEDKNENEKENKDDSGTGDELTLESLKELVTSQAKLIEDSKTDSTNNIAQLKQIIQDRDGDIQNLTNLLGGLANPDDDTGEEEDNDIITKEGVGKLMDKRDEKKKEELKEENKAYFNEYGGMVQELMNEEGPDGKSLSQEARDGIRKLLIDTVVDRTQSPIKDAHKNFKKATKIYFGLDKEHGFKGGSVEGTGSGSSDIKAGSKKTYKLTEEAKKELKALGETEEWGREQLEKRAKQKEESVF